ncbi:MAG: hypothetical protein ACJA0V_000004 [Planctomycetota bacterium]|jgi:hypothetical protein
MSARPMYQPPNPQNMRRLPPASPSCARVRAKLRDYADGDLAMVDVATVDEHLHGCRACAVELARSEHEVLRLRRAFEEIRIEQEADPKHCLRSDFAARVVEQLVMTDAVDTPFDRLTRTSDYAGSESAGSDDSVGGHDSAGSDDSVGGHDSAGSDDSAGGHDSVGSDDSAGGHDSAGSDDSTGGHSVAAGDAMLRKAGAKSSRREGALSFTSPAGMLVAGLAALFILGIGARLMDWSVGEPGPVGRLVIQSAADGFNSNGDRLGGGESVGEGDSIGLGRHGAATMDWHDLSKFAQPAAEIELQGGELQLKNGAPLLLPGSRLLIRTNRPVLMPMADRSRLALGIGDYLIAAIPADRVDDVNQGLDDQSVWGSPSDVRIQVEVLSGQDAKILRSGALPGIVSVGTIASYYGGGGIDRSPSGGLAGGDRDVRAPLAPPTALSASVLTGHVMGPSGPSVGASVGITYIADETEYSDFHPGTGANGSFSMDTLKPADRAFGIAFSIPSPLRPDLGLVAPDAVSLVIHGELAQLEEPLRIEPAALVSGLVTDDQGVSQFGVQVIPLIIDELFGSVYALVVKRVVTSQSGRFKIEQLPAYLPRHQRLAILLVHSQLESVVVPVPVRGSELAGLEGETYVMPRLRTVNLHSIPQGQVTFFEEIPGLPPGAAVVSRVVYANQSGFAVGTKVGSGRLWMYSSSPTPRLKEMLAVPFGSWMQPASTWVNYGERFRPMQNLPGTNIKLESSIRHQRIQITEIPNIVQSQTLQVVDVSGQSVPDAQVFAVSESTLAGNPQARFLGLTGANGVHSLGAVKSTEDVVVIAPSGGLSWVTRPTTIANAVQPVVLRLKESGSALLAESLRPEATDPNRFVKVTFTRAANDLLAGMLPVAVRFVTDGYWEMRDIPAGQYMVEVRGQQYSVVVPASGFVTIDGQ